MADSVRINGVLHDWAAIEIRIGNDRVYGITKLAYKESRSRELVYGADKTRRPRGRTSGKYEVEASMTLHKGSAEEFRALLAQRSADGKSYGGVTFQIVAQFVAPGDTAMTVELNGCVIIEISSDHSEGTSALEESWTIQPMEILTNSRSLFDQSEA